MKIRIWDARGSFLNETESRHSFSANVYRTENPYRFSAVNACKFHRVPSENYTVERPLNERFVPRWITGFSNPLLGNRGWTCEHHLARKSIRSILSSASWFVPCNKTLYLFQHFERLFSIFILFSFFFFILRDIERYIVCWHRLTGLFGWIDQELGTFKPSVDVQSIQYKQNSW